MNITFIISSLSSGGAERVLTLLANKLSKNHNITILTFANDEPYYPLKKSIKHKKLNILKESKGKLESLKNTIHRLKVLKSEIEQENPGVIISFMTHTNILATVVAKISKKKIIISERTAYDFYNSIIIRMLKRIVYPLSSILITQTNADNKHYGYMKNKRVIHNPLDINKCKKKDKENIILAVGRLDKQKGFDALIEVFSNIEADNWELIIAGEGEERANLEKLISDFKANNIKLIGKQKDIFYWYRKASIFVLPSKKEGFPNVLIEAMAFGCAVVSYDCPYGPSEIIYDGQNGILVENQNKEKLTEAIELLVGDVGLRERLSKEAVKVHDRFYIDKIAKEWEEVILKVING